MRRKLHAGMACQSRGNIVSLITVGIVIRSKCSIIFRIGSFCAYCWTGNVVRIVWPLPCSCFYAYLNNSLQQCVTIHSIKSMWYGAIIAMYGIWPWFCNVKFVVGCAQHYPGFRREHISICGVRRSRRCWSSHVLFTESSQFHPKHWYIQEGWPDTGFRRCILKLWCYHCHKGGYGHIEGISRYN